MKHRHIIFCFTLSALLFSGCFKQSPVQNEPPVSSSSANPPAATSAKSAASQETSEEKAVRERTQQLGGTIRKNQAAQIIGIVIENSEQLTIADMQAIAKLSDLESIRLVGPTVTDEYVKAIGSLSKLKSVDIENSNITDESLEILKALPEIETLALRRNLAFTDKAIQLFAEFPNLKTLKILYNGFSSTALMGLGKLESVRVLDLRALPVGDDTLLFIAKLKHLEEIRIKSESVTNFGVAQLKKCKALKIIELQDVSVESGCAEEFKEMEQLRYLRLFRCKQFGAEAIAELGALTNLETLELRDLNSSNESLQALKTLVHLKTVEFSELTDVDAATIVDVLKSYLALENVRMFAMPADDSVAEFLASVPSLKSVALPATAITDKGLDALTALKNLQTLDIHGNKELITLQGAQVLSKFKNLRRLILPETLDDKNLKSTILKSSPRCVTTVKTYSQEG